MSLEDILFDLCVIGWMWNQYIICARCGMPLYELDFEDTKATTTR